MAKARKQAGADKELSAAEQRRRADFLSGTHARLRLWNKCRKPPCRRSRACRGDVDACGGRCDPDGWKWVHGVLQAIRDGRPRTAAMRAADLHAAGIVDRLIVDVGFGQPIEFWVNADGSWTRTDGPRPPLRLGRQFRRLTDAGSAWLDAAPRGEAKD